MKFKITHKLKQHEFTLEIESKEGDSITVSVRVSRFGYADIVVEPTSVLDHSIEFLESMKLQDLVEYIVDSDAFIKYDVEKFQRNHLWKIDYEFDDIKVQSFINKRGDIIWIPIVNQCLVDPDASSPRIVSEYIDYKKPMCGNDIKFEPRIEVRMTYLNMIGLLSAVYFSGHNNALVDTDDDIEDHDDNLRAYTKTPYTEESMAKVNTMAGHNLDTED